MSRRFFGTDGARGPANQGMMTIDFITKLGVAAGTLFGKNGDHRHSVIIGKDTRLSGYMFESALTSGFLSVGMDVFLLGPMPTPAIGMLVRSMRADLGVMISASHNHHYDNGIKLFGPDGCKLTDEIERKIESLMSDDQRSYYTAPAKIGKAKRIDDAPGRYIEFVKNTFPRGMSLKGLKIVIDCANGASYHLGGKILWELGASVIEIGCSPNGANINHECGSNHPELLARTVLQEKADIGIALDGDADRIVVVDDNGQVIDGDCILALIALNLKTHNRLAHNKIVATILSNIAMEHFLNSHGIEVLRSNVGDRYVSQMMHKHKISLGGEQSGHIILGDYNTTGDGLVVGLQLLSIMIERKVQLSTLRRIYDNIPQISKNFKIKEAVMDLDGFTQDLQENFPQERIIIRRSGTEPLIRVMVEGKNYSNLDSIMRQIEDFLV